MEQIALTGNEVVAMGMKQINPEVVAAYPITPQTEIVQLFSQFVADGEVDTEFITVESEHSAMSATVGAAAGGVRAMTATSANGLALMFEVVYIAASTRLPVVMPVVNRALSAPINIHCDHSDAMGCRDSGWIQLFAENSQQVYDNLIQAVRIAEDDRVRLPVMVNMDGFIISHAVENMQPISDDLIREFIGDYQPRYSLLDPEQPATFGPLDLQDYYFEHKRQQVDGMEHVPGVVMEVAGEFAELSGREYGLLEKYKMMDAEVALIGLGSTMGTARAAVDELRQEGKKVGLINLRLFRPFPCRTVFQVLEGIEVLGVLDRAESFSLQGGPLYTEICSCLYQNQNNLGEQNRDNGGLPWVKNYIYGLGGRDITVTEIKDIFKQLLNIQKQKQTGDKSGDRQEVVYFGVRDNS